MRLALEGIAARPSGMKDPLTLRSYHSQGIIATVGILHDEAPAQAPLPPVVDPYLSELIKPRHFFNPLVLVPHRNRY